VAQQGEQNLRTGPIWEAERVILNQLLDSYPAQFSKAELTSIVKSSRINAGDVEDALAELLAQGLIHQQEGADYYWLSRPVVHISELEWSPTSV